MNSKTILLAALLFCSFGMPQKEYGLHFAGEIYGGGIVFYVEKNGKHGLIASLSDVAKDVPWAGKQKPAMSFPQKGVYVIDNTKRLISSDADGEYNTRTILECGYMNSAAWYCSDYSVESGSSSNLGMD